MKIMNEEKKNLACNIQKLKSFLEALNDIK